MSDAPIPTPDDSTLSLAEACRRISAGDGRIELLAAFYAEESTAGRYDDTEAAYRERLATFAARAA